MHENEELIHKLYSSFQELDAETMMSCYHEEASFKDPVFTLQSKKEINGMWTMLCERAKEFELTFDAVKANDLKGSAKWEAFYEFTATSRKVHNEITAHFEFKDGLIVTHLDEFNFWSWSKQALGLPGYLLGWTSFLRKKVQQQANQNLQKFMKRR